MNKDLATIERTKPSLFRSCPAYKVGIWALILHTDQGREEVGTYHTKQGALDDAKEYGITISI